MVLWRWNLRNPDHHFPGGIAATMFCLFGYVGDVPSINELGQVLLVTILTNFATLGLDFSSSEKQESFQRKRIIL